MNFVEHSPTSIGGLFARTFHGITWGRFGFLCAAIALTNIMAFGSALLDGESVMAAATKWLRWSASFLVPAVVMFLCVIAVDNRMSGPPRRRALALTLAVVAGTAVGVLLLAAVEQVANLARLVELDRSFRSYFGVWMGEISVGLVGAAAYFYVARGDEAAAAVHQEALDRVRMANELTQTRLMVLQAQIEPHFLFNTLAHVRRLYETDPATGRTMLRHLSRYLSATLPGMRQSQSTLEREVAITAAYLNVQQIRMEERLAFSVDVPESLYAVPFPPMVLLTLAENAIRHGLGPLPHGGRIDISADARDGQLRVQVADTGRGLAKDSGAGVGLTNIRGRLRALYASGARLRLLQNAAGGVTATIEIPYDAVLPVRLAA